jgi:hypothetical protein
MAVCDKKESLEDFSRNFRLKRGTRKKKKKYARGWISVGKMESTEREKQQTSVAQAST